MASTSGKYGGAKEGAIAGAKLGNMLFPGGVGAAAGAALGGFGGWAFGKKTDEAYDKRQEKIRNQLSEMQGTLTNKVPEILEYYKNLESQSYKEDEIRNRSIVDNFLTQSNQLFESGQQAISRSNLAYGGPLAKDIETNWDTLFSKYRTSADSQQLASDRDIGAINMAQTEAIEKVDNLIEQLEIDKLKYS
tara:strand:+ start:952 stop:1524 length:573 start_codon:yes stop_codon:yes gene_type:complete